LKVLVIGRNGQVARALAERSAGRADLELRCVGLPNLDLEAPGDAERVLSEQPLDIVVNAAAYTAVDEAEDEPEKAFRVNADAAGEIAAAAQRLGVPLIHLSTDYVFDGQASVPYREDSPTGPLNVYGRSKLSGEERVREGNPRHLILRTSWVFSPFGRNFVKTMLRLAEQKGEIAVVDDQVGTPTSAFDVADAVLAALPAVKDGASGTFHFAGDRALSWAELADEVFRTSSALGGPRASVRPISSADYPTRAARPAYSALDSGRFEARFGLAASDSSIGDVVKRIIAAQ
jgi:dTDP-4-dehydrorhamnose reductase